MEAIPMNATTLIQNLMEIERTAGVQGDAKIHGMLIEAQDSVLWLRKDLIKYFRSQPRLVPARSHN
jgi:hypothetical protein